MRSAWLLGSLLLVTLVLLPGGAPSSSPAVLRSPNHVALSADGATAYVANYTAGTVSVIDLVRRSVTGEIEVGPGPAHVVVGPGGDRLYVTSRFGAKVDEVDLTQGRAVRSFDVGLEPYGARLSRDGTRLFVAESIDDTVSVLDTATGTRLATWPVGHEPRHIVETDDGRLFVSHSLDRDFRIIDPETGATLDSRHVLRSSLNRQVMASRDGRYVFVAHVVSHDEAVAMQLERGWIHSNGITLFDLRQPGHAVTLLLDELLRGAANPWGLALSPDGRTLYVTLAGIHEVAIVDVEGAVALASTARNPQQVKALSEDVEVMAREGLAQRVPSGGLGPRGIAYSEAADALVVGNYFSDSLTLLHPRTGELLATIPLGPTPGMTLQRRGELLFNDARICHQNWFSCASCHQEDAGVDALNWDLPNDGVGNPKSAKGLHDAVDTPPAMWSGVRQDMDACVQAGQRFLGDLPEADGHEALIAYLSDVRSSTPNPWLGREPEAVARGEAVFTDSMCTSCHPSGLYTDLKKHDLDLRGPLDQRSRFDTPSLRGVYRTAPYLHDGRAPTLRSVFSDHNPDDRHGRTRALTADQLDDLVAYLRSL